MSKKKYASFNVAADASPKVFRAMLAEVESAYAGFGGDFSTLRLASIGARSDGAPGFTVSFLGE